MRTMKRLTGREIRERAWPLDRLPQETQDRVRAAVEQPRPPSPWLSVCDDTGRPLAMMPSRAWFEWHWHRGRHPSAPEKRRLDAHLRQKIIERDGYRCGLCGGDVEPDDVHIDHIHPYSLGGTDHPDNLQVAHSSCNMEKGNRI